MLLYQQRSLSLVQTSVESEMNFKSECRYTRKYPPPGSKAAGEFHPLFSAPTWKERTGKANAEDAAQVPLH